MSSLIYIISAVSAMPLVAAVGLGIHNTPDSQHMVTYGQSVSRPEAEMYVPIVFEEPRVMQLAEVNIIGNIPRTVEKRLVCGEWRKTRIQRGMVRECNYE